MSEEVLYKAVFRESYTDLKRRSFSVSVQPWNQDYCLNYEKDKIVEKIPGSIGIFCFKDLDSANYFVRNANQEYYQILKVKPLSEIKTNVLYVCDFCNHFKKWYEQNPQYDFTKKSYLVELRVPSGTLVCDKILVLT